MKKMGKVLFILSCLFLAMPNAKAREKLKTLKSEDVEFFARQQKKARLVQGKVIDKSGIALPGVSIVAKGSSLGTTSNVDGRFQLEIPEGIDYLMISYVGMKSQEIEVKGENFFSITLKEDISLLDDVIVVGYGTKTKKDLTTAVDDLDMKKLEGRPLANASSALQGISPGLNVSNVSGREDDAPRINIRGFTSINGGKPLVLIDGVEGNINGINPRDIESISVLKDAGAAAIYGARGGFGVVLIQTKKPKKDALSVKFSSTYNIHTPTTNTNFLTDPYKAVKLVDESFRATTGRSYTGYSEKDYKALKEVAANPSLARVITDNRNGKEQYVHYGATDWWHTFFKKQRPSYVNDISISKGNESFRAYLSYRNYQSKGILKVQDDTYKKNNFRAKLEVDVTDWLTVGNNTQFFNSENLEHGGSQYGFQETWSGNMLVHALPSYVPTNPDGTALWRTELNNYTIGDGVYAALLQGKSKKRNRRNEFSTITNLTIKPIKDFKLHMDYAYRKIHYNSFRRSTRVPYSIYVGKSGTFGRNKLDTRTLNDSYNALNIFGEYAKRLDEHHFNLMAGFNQESYDSEQIFASKQGLISDDLNSLGLGSSNSETSGNGYQWALRGYFFRLSYGYNKKYLLELNGRYDATSRFPKEHRWGFFPSVAVAWNVANEKFMSSISKDINTFKLRASYGSLGNQNIGNYDYIPVLSKRVDGNFAIDGKKLDYIIEPKLSPRNITWEEVRTLNFGVNIGALQNRLGVNFDWFQRDILGMLTQGKTLPAVLGARVPRENSADLRTKGFELALSYTDSFKLLNSDFNFSINAGISDSRTKITKFENPKGSLVDYYKGMVLGEIWGYKVAGLFQSQEEIKKHANQSRVSAISYATGGLKPGDIKFIDLNGDGKVDYGDYTISKPGDLSVIGNSSPRYQYNFSIAFDWKNFDFSTFCQGVGKQDWYPHRDDRFFWAMYNRPYNSFIRKDLADNIWTEDNRNAYFPRLRGYTSLGSNRQLGAVNDRYLQDISYLRVKNITLGYTFSNEWLSRVHINKLRLYFSGENLFTFSKLTDYIDPEAAGKSVDFNNASTGRARAKAVGYPFSKIYSFGLQIDF